MEKEKVSLKFSLEVNSKYENGFKLFVQATDKEAMKIADELTRLLIAKIEKISVELKTGDYE